jgi:hypothetical protein
MNNPKRTWFHFIFAGARHTDVTAALFRLSHCLRRATETGSVVLATDDSVFAQVETSLLSATVMTMKVEPIGPTLAALLARAVKRHPLIRSFLDRPKLAPVPITRNPLTARRTARSSRGIV